MTNPLFPELALIRVSLGEAQALSLRRGGRVGCNIWANPPSYMNTKDELIEWLRDAYAMEKALELSLKNQIDSDDTLQPLREQYETHYVETQMHASAVEGCLKSLGAAPSALKTTFAQTLEAMKNIGPSFAKDAGVKAMLAAYASEHFEIGCYIALAAGARNLDMPDIAKVCDDILVDEKRMAEWLQRNLPNAVTSYLREAEATEAFRPPAQPTHRVAPIDTPIEAGADDDPADAFLNDTTMGSGPSTSHSNVVVLPR